MAEERRHEEKWDAVDEYVEQLFGLNDAVLEAALSASRNAGLPEINVSPAQGQFLHLLARAVRARTILEIGTLAGYSAICLARALPSDGRLTTLELDPSHADVARANLRHAGLADKATVIVGPALDSLATLSGPFDLIFIDANKDGYPAYLSRALRLSRPGTVIVADNVVREGRVADPHSDDTRVKGVRQYLQMVADEPRLSATAIQTVGSKGYDGFALAIVTDAG